MKYIYKLFTAILPLKSFASNAKQMYLIPHRYLNMLKYVLSVLAKSYNYNIQFGNHIVRLIEILMCSTFKVQFCFFLNKRDILNSMWIITNNR